MFRSVPLTQNRYTVIDEEDYQKIKPWNWCVHNGYAVRTEHLMWEDGKRKRKTVFMHRFIAGTPQGLETDHINGDKLDNRKSNLRICTSSQNKHNRQANIKYRSSRYKRVHWNKRAGKWQSQITVGEKQLHLGYFVEEFEAARAYDLAAMKYFGEFAKVNFMDLV